MSIPDYKIDEVREATDVVDLISGYVTLKKKGQNFFGLCPFHTEKTPSFSVNPDKQIFHCFGCSAGGNVFTFLMRSEGISFPESIKFLAQRAGIQIEYDKKDEVRSQENEALYYVNEFAAKFFQESLQSKKGEHALKYLKERGLSSENIKVFGLGYAPPGWQSLITQAKNTSNDLELLHRAGLTLKKEEGGYYDRFRDRIIFPILNLSGRAVAFGGRKLSEKDDSPKYINSPGTSVYEKGKMLYGLFQNRDEIRKQKKSVFVEGYMDLLSLVANDIKNVVASLGTSLTEEQSRLILRYSKHAVLIYDSDAAGVAATLRGSDILLETGLDAFIVSLPKGDDPDSYVLENGTEALLKKIETAENFFDYKIQRSLEKPPENRREEVHSILESIARIKDAIQRSLIITKVSEQLNVSEKALWSD
ncbi:DNA primase, partial [candidate division KSB1 bacterium]|nr:DNA primase [candidate division KSB1 bacterium]